MKEISELDNLSFDILWLLLTKKDLRFNKLYKALQELGVKFSKPTLVNRLGVLTEKGFITRTEEGPQKVIYKLDEDKFHLSKNFKKEYNKIIKYYQTVNYTQKKLSMEDAIKWLLSSILLTYLYELKLKIVMGLPLTILNDERDSVLKEFFSMPYENVLLNNCIIDEDYRKKVLYKIDELIKAYGGEINESS